MLKKGNRKGHLVAIGIQAKRRQSHIPTNSRNWPMTVTVQQMPETSLESCHWLKRVLSPVIGQNCFGVLSPAIGQNWFGVLSPVIGWFVIEWTFSWVINLLLITQRINCLIVVFALFLLFNFNSNELDYIALLKIDPRNLIEAWIKVFTVKGSIFPQCNILCKTSVLQWDTVSFIKNVP